MGFVRLYFPGMQQAIDKLRAETANIRAGARVTVGIHADANPVHIRRKNEKPGTVKATVAEIATWNHFGTERIPARPFLDVGVQSQMNKILKAGKEVFEKKKNLGLVVDAMGGEAVGAVQEYISNQEILPPNAPETIRRKGSSHPLIDIGQLRRSITWRRINGK